ncbi:hypothetical protein NR798_01665 [Archangium gephyra]|uniref:hypothetical protein n=1 Tax=Archangium gephyra TaxID=48 RepID=UPI0035D47004
MPTPRVFRKLAFSTLFAVPLFLGASSASAGPIRFDFCRNAAPDATLTMGPGVNEASSQSKQNFYMAKTDGCLRWVVDVAVPFNSSSTNPSDAKGSGVGAGTLGLPGSAHKPEYPEYSEPDSASGEAYCKSYSETVTVYKKAAGANSFTLIGPSTNKGFWKVSPTGDGYCVLQSTPEQTQGFAIKPPASGTDVYRYAVAVKVDGIHRKVGVTAKHFYDQSVIK